MTKYKTMIPERIKVQGIWWTIRFTNDISNSGETDYDTQEIMIRDTLSPEMKEAVFLHEIFHTINTTIDHPFADSLALQLYQVLKDNHIAFCD
jgi:hypothetical protein